VRQDKLQAPTNFRGHDDIIRKVGEYSENTAAADFFPARFLFSLPRASATSVSFLFANGDV
jgi:hypothetical protein